MIVSGGTFINLADVVESLVIWYYRSTSVTERVGSSWSISKPAYAENTYLWTKNVTTYVDGSTTETAPILDPDWHKILAITDKFGVTQEGGLIAAVMMLLREANSQINTAGFSGIQEDGYSPAYWSGGTYEQALAFSELMRAVDRGDNPIAFATLNAEMSSIALLHNGHAKLGELIVKSNGQIVILDKIAGKIKFVINSQNIPSIADLMDDAVFGETEDNTAVGGITDTITLTKKISVTKDNSTINFGGTISVSVRNNTNFASATMTAELHKEGNYYARLGSISATKNGITLEPASASSVINKTLTGVGRGQYSVKLIVNATGDVRDYVGSISASTLEWSFLQSGVRYFQLGLNGLMAFYSNNHFHFTEDGGLDVRGSVNMPGVLLSATVNENGGWNRVWGAKQSSTQPPLPSPTGRYTIYHTIGHTNYQVNCVSYTENRSFRVYQKNTNSVIVECRTIGSTPALVNAMFDITLTGNNY